MTESQLLDFLYDWIDLVLNTNLSLNIPIIKGKQNAPRPDEQYICIQQVLNKRKIGKTCRDIFTDSVAGTTLIIEDWQAIVTIQEIKGSGDLLTTLIDSQGLTEIRQFWSDNSIAYMREEFIGDISDLTENIWELRSAADIVINYPRTLEEETSIIENVEFTNNI